jgi:hypothetical protein
MSYTWIYFFGVGNNHGSVLPWEGGNQADDSLKLFKPKGILGYKNFKYSTK